MHTMLGISRVGHSLGSAHTGAGCTGEGEAARLCCVLIGVRARHLSSAAPPLRLESSSTIYYSAEDLYY